MAVLENLYVAEAGKKNKASDYNNNFTKMTNYIQASVAEMNTNVSNSLSVYQTVNYPTNTSGTIPLESNKIYALTPSGAVTFSLPTISGEDVNKFHQIYVRLNLDTYYSVNLGTSWTFDNQLPQITTTGKYNLLYEYDGAHWVVGIIKRTEVA